MCIFACKNIATLIPTSHQMITKDSIEAAYSFFHQKKRVYDYSTNPRQRDDIEYAIGSYAGGMNAELYGLLAKGRGHFLLDHAAFASDISEAVAALERLL